VGFRVGLDAVKKRKIMHCRESNPGRPTYIFYLKFISRSTPHVNEVLGITSAHLDGRAQLLISGYASFRSGKYVDRMLTDVKNPCDSFRGEILYDILTEYLYINETS
jgi:hypothetical protein